MVSDSVPKKKVYELELGRMSVEKPTVEVGLCVLVMAVVSVALASGVNDSVKVPVSVRVSVMGMVLVKRI